MAKSYTLYFGEGNSGIDITYVKSRRRVEVSGWYDSCVGIEGGSYSLGEFLTLLGVTLKDCERELRGQAQEASK